MPRSTARRAAGVALGLVAAAAVGGCSSRVDGTGTLSAAATSDPIPRGALPDYLESAPAGSKRWTTVWGQTANPTIDQFVAEKYAAADRDQELAVLARAGLQAVAHRTWNAADHNQADDVLLCFTSVQGAQSHYTSAVHAEASSDSKAIAPSGMPKVHGFQFPGTDSIGNVRIVFYGVARNVTFELWYYSPHTYQAKDAEAWLHQQVDLLR